jgi:hypothetical protein
MALIRHTVALTGAQTAGLILDPTTGTRFVLHRVIVSATVALNIRLFDEADADATILFRIQVLAGTPFILNYPKNEHSNQDGRLLQIRSRQQQARMHVRGNIQRIHHD